MWIWMMWFVQIIVFVLGWRVQVHESSIDGYGSGWDFMGAALVSSDNGAAFMPLLADERDDSFCRFYESDGHRFGYDPI